MVNLSVDIPRALSWLVEPITRTFGLSYAQLIQRFPDAASRESREYAQVLQFWIKFAWTVLAVTSGFAMLIALLAFPVAFGDSYQRYGNLANAPFVLTFTFSASMLLIEYVRASYARLAPARSYDVVLAVTISLALSALVLST